MLSNIDEYYLLEGKDEDAFIEKYDNAITELRNTFDRERCIELLYELKTLDDGYSDKYDLLFYDYIFEVLEILFAKDTLSRREYDDILSSYINEDACDVTWRVSNYDNVEAKNNFCRSIYYDKNDIRNYMICVRDLMDEGIDNDIISDAFCELVEYL